MVEVAGNEKQKEAESPRLVPQLSQLLCGPRGPIRISAEKDVSAPFPFRLHCFSSCTRLCGRIKIKVYKIIFMEFKFFSVWFNY